MWALDSYWIDIAAFLALTLAGHVLLGHFETHKPAWRRVLKVAMGTVLFAAALHFFGREWTWGVTIAIVVVAGILIHGWWLPKHGVHGWTGEPRDKYLELVRARRRGEPKAP